MCYGWCYFRLERSNPFNVVGSSWGHRAFAVAETAHISIKKSILQLRVLSNRMVPPHNLCQPERRISFTYVRVPSSICLNTADGTNLRIISSSAMVNWLSCNARMQSPPKSRNHMQQSIIHLAHPGVELKLFFPPLDAPSACLALELKL